MTDDRLVVLLGEDLKPVGTAPRDQVHHAQTPLHLAFSCYLLDDAGRVLVTRRALTKRTWPGVWTNSFCGHPAPGEEMEHAVRRHARDELGIELSTISLVLPDFRYRAADSNGMVENELCPVFMATTHAPIVAAQHEVAEWTWVDLGALADAARNLPNLLSPWSVLQLARLADSLAVTA